MDRSDFSLRPFEIIGDAPKYSLLFFSGLESEPDTESQLINGNGFIFFRSFRAFFP